MGLTQLHSHRAATLEAQAHRRPALAASPSARVPHRFRQWVPLQGTKILAAALRLPASDWTSESARAVEAAAPVLPALEGVREVRVMTESYVVRASAILARLPKVSRA